ncbi:hypothetical protein QA600_15780 [Natronococcus sp. A-GB1]|uniref:hypothetical protein n=1 Tax=Natronococcus sp. A-GB1 TaxID=3037648 RepID=UPI00241EF0F9|nr:hypothetical protein [Natronococcus sp. A-GB1]MDG5760796.1 hypothetical protein [Natronococcus sp. A-GB1]
MIETEFPWGTVIHGTESKTGETTVEITVESENSVSVETIAAPDARTDFFDGDDPTDGNRDAEMETFQWGAVTYESDPDAGVTDVRVIVDAEDDIDLSVTTISGGAESTSRSIVQTDDFGDRFPGDESTAVSRSTSSSTSVSRSTNVSRSSKLSQSSSVSQSTNVSQSSTTSSGDDWDDSTSIPIDDTGDEDE